MISDDGAADGPPQALVARPLADSPTPSAAVVEAIADAEEVDPAALPTERDICLYDHVDPDALDTVVGDGSRRGDPSVTFSVGAYNVVVAERRVEVFRREPTAR